jgi:hypothetical protein
VPFSALIAKNLPVTSTILDLRQDEAADLKPSVIRSPETRTT